MLELGAINPRLVAVDLTHPSSVFIIYFHNKMFSTSSSHIAQMSLKAVSSQSKSNLIFTHLIESQLCSHLIDHL